MLCERIKFTADLEICKVFLKIDNCDRKRQEAERITFSNVPPQRGRERNRKKSRGNAYICTDLYTFKAYVFTFIYYISPMMTSENRQSSLLKSLREAFLGPQNQCRW